MDRAPRIIDTSRIASSGIYGTRFRTTAAGAAACRGANWSPRAAAAHMQPAISGSATAHASLARVWKVGDGIPVQPAFRSEPVPDVHCGI